MENFCMFWESCSWSSTKYHLTISASSVTMKESIIHELPLFFQANLRFSFQKSTFNEEKNLLINKELNLFFKLNFEIILINSSWFFFHFFHFIKSRDMNREKRVIIYWKLQRSWNSFRFNLTIILFILIFHKVGKSRNLKIIWFLQ
jgi:hypothetical protein